MKRGTRVEYHNGQFMVEAVVLTRHRAGDYTILFTESKLPVKQGETHRCSENTLNLIGQKVIDWPEPQLTPGTSRMLEYNGPLPYLPPQ